MQNKNSLACLLDQNIREALKRTLREQDSSAAIIDELPLLRGRGRADLAFVNGEMWGFEIKSEADSLVRLGVQADNYESVFEFNTIVAARKHLRLARKKIPTNWGIIEARQIDGETRLHHKYRLSKEFLFEFTKQHPEVLKAYKETLPDKAKPLNDVSIEDRQQAPREAAASDSHRKLEEIPTGTDNADLYHRTILGLLTEIFYPWLTPLQPLSRAPGFFGVVGDAVNFLIPFAEVFA